jgi:soluble lytic murein transglycosylase-like protein
MKFLMLLAMFFVPQCAKANVDRVCERMKYKDCSLVKAIIQYESSGNPLAIGHDGKGSLGLMQIKCDTARTLDRIHGRKPIICKMLFNPTINVYYGIQYLEYIEELLSKKPTMHEILSVYNGGYEFHKPTGHYRVKRCNAISIKKKRKCNKGEPFNIEYSRKVIQIYDKLIRSQSNGT